MSIVRLGDAMNNKDQDACALPTKLLLESTLILLRNSTYKCGKLERQIVQFLQRKLRKATVKSLLNNFKNMGARARQRIYESIRRLHHRKIIEIKNGGP